MALFLKHVDGSDTAQVGYVGVPNGTDPASVFRHYRTGDRVLLAVPMRRGEGAIRGKVFGLCTLLYLTGDARELGNPEKLGADPALADRWPGAIAIREAWALEQPVPYAQFSDVAEAAQTHGHFAEISNPERVAFFDALPWRPVEVYHSPRARALLEMMGK